MATQTRLNVGNGCLRGVITADDINYMRKNKEIPHIQLWERIKDFFCSTNIEKAMEYFLFIIEYNESKSECEDKYRVLSAGFNEIKKLASPGCWDYFKTEDHGDVTHFSVKDATMKEILTFKCTSNFSLIQEKFSLAKEINKIIKPFPEEKPSLLGIDRVVVFGDSLSDSEGRMLKRTDGILPSEHQYYNGRFTNGFVWAEYLSLPDFLGKETLNFAEGGSTSASYSCFNITADFLSNMSKQMKSYKASAKDLVICLLGGNDYITLHKNNVSKVVEQQITNFKRMLNRGVKSIIVMGIPDLSLTPRARESNKQKELQEISMRHNDLLQEKINKLKEENPGANIKYFDTPSAFEQITKAASNVGYDTEHAYNTEGYIHIPWEEEPALNTEPRYIYNDKIHPTQEVHQAFALILTEFIIKELLVDVA